LNARAEASDEAGAEDAAAAEGAVDRRVGGLGTLEDTASQDAGPAVAFTLLP
jgi:hypothetical protein